MSQRNFSAGPGALPRSVLLQAQEAVLALPGAGVSILGLSHRSSRFRDILDEAELRLRRLLDLPSRFHVLFLQGGATLQFSMVPMAMLPAGGVADYLVAGYWSRKAFEAARNHGVIHCAWDASPFDLDRLPKPEELAVSTDAAYLHYVSNETVEGLQFQAPPAVVCPLVCDMSSDFLSRPLDLEPFSLVYAHAQKNLGPAGATVVLVSEAVLEQMPEGLPSILDYRSHAKARSLFNTPNVFAIYVMLLVLRWLEDEIGGLARMGEINAQKTAAVREALAEKAHFYRNSVEPCSESDMNVTFACPDGELDATFLAEAERAGFIGLNGHRSRRGLRISLYNGVTLDDARVMADFLREFAGR